MTFAQLRSALIRLATFLALAAVLGSAACTTTESGSGALRAQSAAQVRPAPTLGVGY